ncbi:MAG TPA: hypothetical protein VNE39_20145, partial [Planctomycetota bacterium]|nr:hypothetical protein [Planctomycetota bacterium]
ATRHGALRVVDEIWLTDSGTQAMCEALGQRLEKSGCRLSVVGYRGPEHRTPKTEHPVPVPVFVYGDAAGHARSTAGRSDYAIIRQCFPQARFCVPGANPARRDRYNAVNAALCDAAGRVRLRIHPRCQKLITDLEEVVYQPYTGMPDTSKPERGHISDALGYLVARVMPAGSAALRVGQW